MEIPCFVCSHVFNNSLPILLASKMDGDWQFLCGGEHSFEEIPKVIGLNHVLEHDYTITDILDLKDNYEAERKNVGGKWKRKKSSI